MPITVSLPNATNIPATRYRALNRYAVWSFVLGLLSALTFLHWLLALIPLAAIAVGWRALGQIDRTREEYTGERLAQWGIGLAVVLLFAGSIFLFVGRNAVPHGYLGVDFEALQSDRPGELIPPLVNDLKDKKIYVKGYMMATRQQNELKRFVLCRTIDQCRFNFPILKTTDLIVVHLEGDLTTSYQTGQIAVGGTFHCDPNDPDGRPYMIEADYLR